MRIVVPSFSISSYYERRAKQLMRKRREPTVSAKPKQRSKEVNQKASPRDKA